MSYFPTPRLPFDPSIKMNLLAYDTLSAPEPSYRASDEWFFGDQLAEDDASHGTQHPWNGHTPHGLDVTVSPPQERRVETVSRHMLPRTMSQTWSEQLIASTSQAASEAAFRQNSWTDGCDPSTTLLPSAFWDPSQEPNALSALTHQSPAQSEYSLSSHLSCNSSPYARSEGFVRTVPSPFIKAEEPERAIHPIRLFSEGSPVMQPLLVRPGDLVADRSVVPTFSVGFSGMPTLAAQFSPLRAEKAASERPHARKAFSSEDVRRAVGEERQKRGFTKPENASCKCDQCGKLFQRSYNLKAHMETHDPFRSHPYECPYEICKKQFVRRTDLTRHEQSVHLKARNYACPRCDASFARKDTLTRHIDDGCPKRTEVKKHLSKSRRSSNSSNSGRLVYRSGRDSFSRPSPLRNSAELP